MNTTIANFGRKPKVRDHHVDILGFEKRASAVAFVVDVADFGKKVLLRS